MFVYLLKPLFALYLVCFWWWFFVSLFFYCCLSSRSLFACTSARASSQPTARPRRRRLLAVYVSSCDIHPCLVLWMDCTIVGCSLVVFHYFCSVETHIDVWSFPLTLISLHKNFETSTGVWEKKKNAPLKNHTAKTNKLFGLCVFTERITAPKIHTLIQSTHSFYITEMFCRVIFYLSMFVYYRMAACHYSAHIHSLLRLPLFCRKIPLPTTNKMNSEKKRKLRLNCIYHSIVCIAILSVVVTVFYLLVVLSTQRKKKHTSL